MYDSTSCLATSISLATLGKVLRNRPATVRDCPRAALPQRESGTSSRNVRPGTLSESDTNL